MTSSTVNGSARTPTTGGAEAGVDPVEEWGIESFPASDPPSSWQGPEEEPPAPADGPADPGQG